MIIVFGWRERYATFGQVPEQFLPLSFTLYDANTSLFTRLANLGKDSFDSSCVNYIISVLTRGFRSLLG